MKSPNNEVDRVLTGFVSSLKEPFRYLGKSTSEYWQNGPHESPQTTQDVANIACCSLKTDSKTPLQKTIVPQDMERSNWWLQGTIIPLLQSSLGYIPMV